MASDRRRRNPALFDDARARKIYRTAARMIYERGFASTSMNEIAEAVELTKPGLYYYVKGKKELLASIINFGLDLLEEGVIESSSPLEVYRAAVAAQQEFISDGMADLLLLFDDHSGLSQTQAEQIVSRKKKYLDHLNELISNLEEGKYLDQTSASILKGLELGALVRALPGIQESIESRLKPQTVGGVALVWDPSSISAEDYSRLVTAVGNLARASGSAGVKRVLSDFQEISVEVGVLV